MQPQGREVCVENDEYEWEQQSLVKQINHVVVLRNDYILSFCVVQKCAHILEPFQRNTYTLLSFSHFVAHFIPKAHATPTNSNPHMLVQRSWRCTRGIHCKYIHLVILDFNLIGALFLALNALWGLNQLATESILLQSFLNCGYLLWAVFHLFVQQKERNGPSCANQGLFIASQDSCYVHATPCLNLCTLILHFLLVQPIFKMDYANW